MILIPLLIFLIVIYFLITIYFTFLVFINDDDFLLDLLYDGFLEKIVFSLMISVCLVGGSILFCLVIYLEEGKFKWY
jgi:hypothetical protein